MPTPLMKQYARVKAQYPGTILLFRMGDFYETFEEDAVTASKALGITLTSRGNGAAESIPLAGFPYHALDSYLPRLLKAGHRVAICEQLEDPKLARGIVKRDVVEVVTPGVAFSDKVLDGKHNNYLAALALPSPLASGDDVAGLAFADVSTGEFSAGEIAVRTLAETVASLAPSEILVQKRDSEAVRAILRGGYGGLVTKMDDWLFHPDYASESLRSHFGTHSLKGFGMQEMRTGIVAAGAVMSYLAETQKSNLAHFRKIIPYDPGDAIVLDGPTKRNLEITTSVEGGEAGTLFWVLDRTLTPMGGRLLKKWIGRPLRRREPIEERLEAVDELVHDAGLRSEMTGLLGPIGDIERLMGKICTGRANPRELAALGGMLSQAGNLAGALGRARSATLSRLAADFRPVDEVVRKISGALSDEPPLAPGDGTVFRPGYDPHLDGLREAARNGKSWIANLQESERRRTGIPSLKVGFNNVFGYYIEITNTHREKVPPEYIRRQTMVSAERFITPGLKEQEDLILHAEERLLDLERRLFTDLRSEAAQHADAVLHDAHIVAMLDCFASLAGAAEEYGYVRPEIDEGPAIEISGGRHPVIERLLPPGEAYVPNDVSLSGEGTQIMIVTGPNMSGKSSFLRQTGLIVLLAQTGSFVPAAKARIGIVDRIYTRVGASDNIAAGESTFLVEMHEAANILNTATAGSLVLLDEVGRGTSTFDGISIAWALTEYLHERVGAKTLFATHYHELNELASLFPRVVNFKVDVREYGDKVIFLHKVTPGAADHSYGIQVAQMAGLPGEVTERAKQILTKLEGSAVARRDGAPDLQLTLFGERDEELKNELRNIDIERMTPLEALHALADLRKRIV